MYDFEDYFDSEKRERPYLSAQEEVEDYLRLLDMLLEAYLEFKGLGSEQKLFSRGLVITESEMERYFSMPPQLRERDICDPVLTNAADAAFDYIEGRAAKTLGYMMTGAYEGIDSLDDSLRKNAGATGTFDGTYDELDVLWIESLRNLFGLDRTGVMAVVMALAGAIDRKYERVFGFLQDDITRTRPTVGLLEALMARVTPRDGAEDLLHRPLPEELFRSLFIAGDEERGLDTPLILNPLMERILLEVPETDDKLPEPVTLVEEEPGIPLFFNDIASDFAYALEDPQNSFCYVENADEETVLHIAALYADAHEEPLFVLDLERLMQQSRSEQSACLADLALRLRLGNGRIAVKYKTGDVREDGPGREMTAKRRRFLQRIRSISPYTCIILFGEAKEPGELIRDAVPFLTVAAPDVTLRTKIWTYFLMGVEEVQGDGSFAMDVMEDGESSPLSGDRIGVAGDVAIEDLADCFDISYGTIKNACSHARAAARVGQAGSIDRSMILESLRQLCQVDFSGLANYVRAVYTWEDIKLTDEQRDVLKVACDRYRLRNRIGQGWGLSRKNAYGNGVSLLLYGPPGTGKTMAAQVVAGELGLPLYRVDISQIFSKYIGETEKNLSIIFDAAKGANVILFFDEADALFAKRTEVNNANDKYANSETAYLLQKIEEYDGMSILATNLYTSFDPAFVRRITYAVRLDSPDEGARYTLWTTILPPETELGSIPFRYLAKHFELSGSNIKAILYSAVYMAGAAGEPVGVQHIVRAMEYEFRKLGRYIDRDAFGPYAKYLSGGASGGKAENV